MSLVECETKEPLRVLEIGHYYGLSTCGLVHALRRRGGTWSLVSVDAHKPDGHIATPAGMDQFLLNMKAHFNDRRLHAVHADSQSFTAPIRYDFVFYDGDHREEQARFTAEVIKSPEVQTFVFDDADFEWPARCADMLRQAGWRDCSPELSRAADDKASARTMTLGVFRRANR